MKRAGVLMGLAGLLASAAHRPPILIQSFESKTREGTPVFNRIDWTPGWRQDVWVMQQSHSGLPLPEGRWDRLAIVVDKTRTPKVAQFFQLEAGQLAWDPQAKLAPRRATCFMCHSNGPRAVRPDLDPSRSAVAVSWFDRARLTLWNLRIKTYGRVLMDPTQVQASQSAITPLRLAGTFDNEKLPAKTCATCHNENPWGRGVLTRQNFMAIGFMLKNEYMPPLGFVLKPGEKECTARFLSGLPTRPTLARQP